jgi:hypothetical protein
MYSVGCAIIVMTIPLPTQRALLDSVNESLIDYNLSAIRPQLLVNLGIFKRSSAPSCSQGRNTDVRAVLGGIERLLLAIVPNRAGKSTSRNTAASNLAEIELPATEVAKSVFEVQLFLQ